MQLKTERLLRVILSRKPVARHAARQAVAASEHCLLAVSTDILLTGSSGQTPRLLYGGRRKFHMQDSSPNSLKSALT